MWNGVNYLLKMPSDLDFLSEYQTVRKWLGFSIVRNPFCVPFPMEEGAVVFSGKSKQKTVRVYRVIIIAVVCYYHLLLHVRLHPMLIIVCHRAFLYLIC